MAIKSTLCFQCAVSSLKMLTQEGALTPQQEAKWLWLLCLMAVTL